MKYYPLTIGNDGRTLRLYVMRYCEQGFTTYSQARRHVQKYGDRSFYKIIRGDRLQAVSARYVAQNN